VIADNWQPSPTLDDMVSPLVTDTTIPGTGQYPALPGWYYAGPEIWTAAARGPNVWGDILKDTYPKPGSLTWDAAPAWYTWSYPDSTVTTEKPTYFWGTVSLIDASGRSYSAESQRTGTLKYRFYGSSFAWVYTKSNKAGIASVKVDGTEVGPIDQYSAATQFKVSSPFSGFAADAYHDVVIVNAGRNGASGGLFMNHDAFIGKTDPADPIATTPRENNADGSTAYDWGHLNLDPDDYSCCKSQTGGFAYTFNKTSTLNSFTWKYLKSNKGGIARVLVDGKVVGSVDCYAAATAPGQTSFDISTFSTGWHTIFINANGRNATSRGFWIYHDALVFGTTTVQN